VRVTVRLSARDVAFLNRYVETSDEPSRSAVVRKALARFREEELRRQYSELWAEWDEEEDAVWDVTLADGLEDEPEGAWEGLGADPDLDL
jgi:Arc/MetJ-type ribon-helix-helix transcriptional regulator